MLCLVIACLHTVNDVNPVQASAAFYILIDSHAGVTFWLTYITEYWIFQWFAKSQNY